MAKVTSKSTTKSSWLDTASAKARRRRVTQDNRLEFLASLAIEENQFSELQRLLDSNSDEIAVNTRLASSLLVTAIARDRIEVVRLLLAHGVDANTPIEMPPHGKRPNYVALHYAAERGREEIFQLLRVQTKRKHYASAGQLLEIGKLPRETIVQMQKLRLAASRGSMQTILRMIQAGCDVNQITSSDRLLPIHTAAMDNQLLATEVLLAAGAKPNAQTEFGFTPYFFARNSH